MTPWLINNSECFPFKSPIRTNEPSYYTCSNYTFLIERWFFNFPDDKKFILIRIVGNVRRPLISLIFHTEIIQHGNFLNHISLIVKHRPVYIAWILPCLYISKVFPHNKIGIIGRIIDTQRGPGFPCLSAHLEWPLDRFTTLIKNVSNVILIFIENVSVSDYH